MSGMPQITNIDNRPWFKKPIGIAGIVGGVLVLGGIASATGGGDDSKDSDPKDPGTSASQPQDSGSDKSPSSEENEKPEPEPKWVTVAELSGNTSKGGPDFELEGCDTRLKYDVKGSGPVIVAFYVLESGTQLMEDGGFPEASPTEAGSGETVLRKDEGEYYIHVEAANADWSAKVQEKC